MSKATLAAAGALALILIGAIFTIGLAKGYQFDIVNKSLTSTGILVATSDPDGAEVVLNGKLKTATNNSINLDPGHYTIQIQKEGYTSWEKEVDIKKEEVFKTNVFLFPALSNLSPLTLTGAIKPTLSSDKTKIAYGIASASAKINTVLDGNGIWIIDMSRNFLPSQIFSASDFRQIYSNTDVLNLSDANYLWSPDDKQLLAYYGSLATPSAAYILDTDRINESPTSVLYTLAPLLENWKTTTTTRQEAQLTKLPLTIRETLATNAGELAFSPDGTKVLYTATASGLLPHYLTGYLPGANPTTETRELKPTATYVYDVKEDKNFKVPDKVSWFPSSRHLIQNSSNQISVMEYDGTNQATVFSGQFDPQTVFVWPNWSKVVILTPLGNTNGTEKNLYTVNLR